MRLSRLGVAAVLAASVSSRAAAQKEPLSAGRAAGEVAAGFVGVPVGFAVGYTIGSGLRPHGSSNPGVAVGFAGAIAGSAAGVTLAGRGGPAPRGTFAAAAGGSAVGFLAAAIAVPIVQHIPLGKLKPLAYVGIAFLPAIGATVGYNGSRR
jgi:hypothetical protein